MGKNRLLAIALFAVAAAIVFHAWWPGYKANMDAATLAAEQAAAFERKRAEAIQDEEWHICLRQRKRQGADWREQVDGCKHLRSSENQPQEGSE